MSSPTLRDLAKLAGVSATTVSKALRNDPKISQSRRAEILALAERHGYRSNPALSAWMRRVRDIRHPTAGETLAYVTSRPLAETLSKRGGWANRYHSGAMAMARRLDYRCATFSIEDYQDDWARLLDVLHHRGVRGIAIGPLAGAAPPPADDPRFSLASIESLSPEAPSDWVSTDHYAGMLMALAEVRRRGHRRIGYVRSTISTQEHERWRAAFSLYQDDLSPADTIPVLDAPGGVTASVDMVRRWMGRHGPTVIIGADGGLPSRMRRAGFSIPGDIAFITLDHEGAGGTAAGVNQRMAEVGATLIQLLAMKLELNETGPVRTARSLLLQPQWVDGPTLP